MTEKIPDMPQVVKDNEHIILFDGVCNLCSGWVQFLIARDPLGQFKFCSVQSAEGKNLLRWLGLSTEHIETMAYIKKGQPFLRSTAFFEIVKQLPRGWPLLAVGLLVPTVLRDALYNVVAANRYHIGGKRAECLLPTDDIKERFIAWNTTH